MTRTVVKNGWYCVARNGRIFVAIKGVGLVTRNAAVPFPRGNDALFLELAADGRLACQDGMPDGQPSDDRAWLLDGSLWSDQGRTFNNNATFFDRDGKLHVAQEADVRATGLAGFRFQDAAGRIWSATETYEPKDGIPIHAWTDFGPFRIGQGSNDDGIHVWRKDEGFLRVLEPGNCLDVKAYETNGRYDVAAWKPGTPSESVLFEGLTLADLKDDTICPKFAGTIPSTPPVTRPVWIEGVNCRLVNGVWTTLDGQPIAVWVYLENLEDQAAQLIAAAKAAHPGVPISAYWKNQQIPDWLVDAVPIVSFPVYRMPGESIAALASRTRAALDRVREAWLILRFYTSNNVVPVQQVLECLPFYAELLNDPRVKGCGMFGLGLGRADGDGNPTYGETLTSARDYLGRDVQTPLIVSAPSPTPPQTPTPQPVPKPTPVPPKGQRPMTPEERDAYHATAIKALSALKVNNPKGLADEVRGDFERTLNRMATLDEYKVFAELKDKRPAVSNAEIDELVRGCLQ